jgi:hypothetical protein
MNNKTAIIITGDGSGGVRAIKATKNELGKFNTEQKKTATSSKSLKTQLGGMIGKLTVAGTAVAGVTTLVGGLGVALRVDAIKEIGYLTDALGLSASVLTEWGYATETVGFDVEKMGDIFKDVQDKIGDFAATGGGEAGDIFNKLGLDIEKVINLSADEQLLAIADGLENISSQSEKIFYLEAMANDASRLLPLLDNNAEGLRELQEESRILGVSLTDIDNAKIEALTDSTHTLSGYVEGAANQFTIALAPAITAITDELGDALIEAGGLEGAFESMMDISIQGLGFLADQLKSVEMLLGYSKLGWLYIGKAATSAMAATAESTAGVINSVLDPFLDIIALIAEGWGHLITEAGEFLGNDDMTSFGQSLTEFADSARGFEISAEDIIAADNAMADAISRTEQELLELRDAQPGDDLWEWWQKVKEEAQGAAEAQASAKKESRDSSTKNTKTTKSKSSISTNKELDAAIKQAEKFGDAWGGANDTIIETFGNLADNLSNYADQQRELFELEATLAEQRIKLESAVDPDIRKAGLERLTEAEEELASKRTQANMSSFAAITGAASSMFAEQSKGREALHKAEQVFAIAEMALAIQKAGANAIAAITTQGQGDPYTAFARIAAMGAIMAGLGVFDGDTGGQIPSAEEIQENQGTGTVLGDSSAKSESISSSFDRMISLEADQYAELMLMNKNLTSLINGIESLVVTLVQNSDFETGNYDGYIGSDSSYFGTYKTDVKNVDSGISIESQSLSSVLNGQFEGMYYDTIEETKEYLWGLSSSSNTTRHTSELSDGIKSQFTDIYTSISGSIYEAASSLGFDSVSVENYKYQERAGFGSIITEVVEVPLAEALNNIVLPELDISFKDLSGEEIQEELEAVISANADLIATTLVPELTRWQNVGEGAYETLTRVSTEQAIFNNVLDLTKTSLVGLNTVASIDVAQNIIELAGGIEELSSAANSYFSNFFSEAEQLAFLQSTLTDQFSAIGYEIPESKAAFKSLIESLDLTTESGQYAYTQLLKLSPSLSEFFDSLEDNVEEIADLSATISSSLDELFNTDLLSQYEEMYAAEELLFDTRTALYETQIQQQQDLLAYVNELKFGDLSILAPEAQLEAAAAQFDTADITNAQEFSNIYLESARAMYGSSQEYTDIFEAVTGRLMELSTSDVELPDDTLLNTLSAELELLRSQAEVAEDLESLTELFNNLAYLGELDSNAFSSMIDNIFNLSGLDPASADGIDALISIFEQATGIGLDDSLGINGITDAISDLVGTSTDLTDFITAFEDAFEAPKTILRSLGDEINDFMVNLEDDYNRIEITDPVIASSKSLASSESIKKSENITPTSSTSNLQAQDSVDVVSSIYELNESLGKKLDAINVNITRLVTSNEENAIVTNNILLRA